MADLPQVGAEAVVQNLAGFRSAMEQINKGLNDASKASDNLASSSGGVSKALAAAANIGMAAIAAAAVTAAAAIAGVTVALVDCIKEAMISQDVEMQLNAVLQSTGNIAGITRAKLQEYADSLMNVTRFDDEAAMSAETVILQFQKIGADIFPMVLKASADLATRMGTDLPAAAQIVARAIGDPEQGIGRLNMAFRLFDDTQLKTVEDMAKAGDVAGAQTIILDALTKKIGGAAEAAGRTFGGAMDIFKNKLGNIKEAIGGPFLSILGNLLDAVGPVLLNALEGLIPIVNNLAYAFTTFIGKLSAGSFVSKLLPALSDAFQKLFGGATPNFDWLDALAITINRLSGPLAEIITLLASGDVFAALGVLTGGNQDAAQFFAAIATAVTVASAVISSFVDTLKTTLGPTFQGIFDQLTGLLGDFGLNWGDVWEAVKQAVTIVASVIGAILVALVGVIVGVVSGIASAIEQMIANFRAILPHIMGVVEGVIKVLTGLWLFFDKLFKGDFPAAFEALKTVWEGVWQTFSEIMLTAWESVKGTFNTISAFVSGFVDGIVTFFTGLYEKLVGHSIIIDMVEGILGAFNNLISTGTALFSMFTDGIFGVAEELVGRVVGLFSNIGAGIQGALSGAAPAAPGAEGQGQPGTAPAGGQPAGGGGQIEALNQQIIALKASFADLLSTTQIMISEFLTTVTMSFMTLSEMAINPFILAMQEISAWITIGAGDFERMGRAVLAMVLSFASFKMEAIASVIELVLAAQAQFNIFGLYLETNKGNWAKSWLDFVVAMEVQTSTAVNYIIGEFDRLGRNVSGSSVALTTAFGATMDGVTTQITGQLTPVLASGGGAFKSLANAAIAAANEVASAAADICGAVSDAYTCATGSPELIIQHPFENFVQFLEKNTPTVQGLIQNMVSPLANVSSTIANFSQTVAQATQAANAAGTAATQAGAAVANAAAQPVAPVHQGMALPAGAMGGTTVTNNYNYSLGPVYQQPQAVGSMMDDLHVIHMLSS